MHVVETPPQRIRYGESMPFELDVDLDGLGPEDVVVECVLGSRDELGTFTPETHVPLRATGEVHGGSTRFRVDLSTTDEGLSLAGQKLYKVRMYPHHRLLSHRFECGLMRWL
jgi:starch phosphorylase